jgi:hypothetical protein
MTEVRDAPCRKRLNSLVNDGAGEGVVRSRRLSVAFKGKVPGATVRACAVRVSR